MRSDESSATSGCCACARRWPSRCTTVRCARWSTAHSPRWPTTWSTPSRRRAASRRQREAAIAGLIARIARGPGGGARRTVSSASGRLDVRRLLALGTGHHVELDLLPLLEALEAVHLD